MKLSDIVNGPWMITEPALAQVQEIYDTHMRGEKIDFAGIEARIGRPLENKQDRGYQITDRGVAVIPVEGTLAKRANLMHRMSGGASYQIIEQNISSALDDPAVSAISLEIDSPGGTVDGAFELADFIRRAAEVKPIHAYTDGMMCSAAYLIGAACQSITMLAPGSTNTIGSIGVIATHTYKEQEGAKTTHIVSGRYKMAISRELTDETLSLIQSNVDYLASQFIDSVAAWRGIEAAAIAAFEGRTFAGQQALDVGLVDGVSTLDALLASIADGVSARSDKPAIKEQKKMSEQKMTLEALKADHPELFRAALEEGKKLGMAEGATLERERIKAVQDQCAVIPGHAKLAAELMFDGKTSAAEAAVQILAAERVKLSAVGKALASEAPDPAMTSEPTQPKAPAQMTAEERAKNWKTDGFFAEADAIAYWQAAEKNLIKARLEGGK